VNQILQTATSIRTPLALGGMFAAILFFLLRQMLAKNIFPALSRNHGAEVIKLIIDRLFVLALVAMVLGFAGYLVTEFPSTHGENVRTTDLPRNPPVYLTCRRPEFGRIGWGRTEQFSGNSGWRGGGTSQPDWCRELAGQSIRSRSIGEQNEVATVASSEDSHFTWDRRAEYNYSCTVRISWAPIYAERQDVSCGVAAN